MSKQGIPPHPEKLRKNSGDNRWRERVFTAIVYHYTSPYLSLIRQRTGDIEFAEDILQESFMKMWKGLLNFRFESTLFSWGYRICINASYDYVRKNKHKLQPITEGNQNDVVTTTPLSAEKIQELLHHAIEKLEGRQQEVFIMRYFEDKPYKEISELLGVTEGALKASYHIAAKKVESYLKEQLD
jgi:RNA polymerase sigma factor (sigma-70 family)